VKRKTSNGLFLRKGEEKQKFFIEIIYDGHKKEEIMNDDWKGEFTPNPNYYLHHAFQYYLGRGFNEVTASTLANFSHIHSPEEPIPFIKIDNALYEPPGGGVGVEVHRYQENGLFIFCIEQWKRGIKKGQYKHPSLDNPYEPGCWYLNQEMAKNHFYKFEERKNVKLLWIAFNDMQRIL
jgi:hypothetical protein